MPRQFVLTAPDGQYLYDQIQKIATTSTASKREQLASLRPVSEALMKKLTARENIYFTTLFDRMVYVYTKSNAPKSLVDGGHEFRKLANQCSHDIAFEPTAAQARASVKMLCDTVDYFGGGSIPEALNDWIGGDIPRQEITTPVSIPARDFKGRVEFVKGVVVSAGQMEHSSTGQRETKVVCEVEIPDGYGTVAVTLSEPWASTPLWLYANILITELEGVSDGVLRTTAGSLVVLEPDVLISASDIAESYQNNAPAPLLYGLKKFQPNTGSEAQVTGNVVNGLFDILLRDPNAEFEESFRKVARQHGFQFAMLSQTDDGAIFKKARAQFPTLKQVVSSFNSKSINIEPTFLSSRFGLQGRLDALLEQSSGHRPVRDVVELKSGKPPSSGLAAPIGGNRIPLGVWPNNYLQATCYDLLMRSTYQEAWRGTTALLYSQDSVSPLRNVTVTENARQVAISLRNSIAAIEHGLCVDAMSFISRLAYEDVLNLPSYMVDDLAKFREDWQNASLAERAYFASYASYIAREHMIARVGSPDPDLNDHGFAGLWLETIEQKTLARNILAYLALTAGSKINARNEIELVMTRDDYKVTNFREGDIVVLYEHDAAGNAAPLGDQLLKGVIRSLDRSAGRVSIALRNPSAALKPTPAGFWAVEHDVMDNSFTSLYQSLRLFLAASPEKRDLMLGKARPRVNTLSANPLNADNLNSVQEKLLKKALESQDYFLLQGPPGTGKTSRMIRAMIRYLATHTQENILLLVFTNRAASEICGAIEDVCDYIRLGASGGQENEDQRRIEVFAQNSTVPETRSRIQKARVFVSTISTALLRQDLFRLKHFHTAIVDESSQLLEPHLTGLLAQVGRFILVGDEKQLPAVVTQPEESTIVNDACLHELGIYDLRISFFERLLDNAKKRGWTSAYGMLEQQGRMHVDIQKFPGEQFYDGKLCAQDDRQNRPIHLFHPESKTDLERMLALSRTVFFPSEAEKRSQVNLAEAERVACLVKMVRDMFVNRGGGFNVFESVGVITPFRAQAAEIYKQLPSDLQGVTVDTVERYQGSQREVIIISFAVNYSQQLRAIQSLGMEGRVDRKLNVALTRAREHLIVLGNPNILRQSRHTKAWLEHIERSGGYQPYFPLGF